MIRKNDGADNQELRKCRLNRVSSYRFRSDCLKGFGVGGAARWRSKVTIGWPIGSTGLAFSEPR